jgi:hypothetical protein
MGGVPDRRPKAHPLISAQIELGKKRFLTVAISDVLTLKLHPHPSISSS